MAKKKAPELEPAFQLPENWARIKISGLPETPGMVHMILSQARISLKHILEQTGHDQSNPAITILRENKGSGEALSDEGPILSLIIGLKKAMMREEGTSPLGIEIETTD